MEPAPDLDQLLDRAVLVTQALDSHSVGGVAGVSRNREFVIDDTDRNAVTAEAADDAQTLVITTHHDGADAVPGDHPAGARATEAVTWRAAISAPDTKRQMGP